MIDIIAKTIECNACGNEILIEDVLFQEIKQELEEKIQQKEKIIDQEMKKLKQSKIEMDNKLAEMKQIYRQQVIKDRERIRNQVKQEMSEEIALKIKLLEEDIKLKENKIKEIQSLETMLINKQQQLEKDRINLEVTISNRLLKEKEKIFEDAHSKAKQEIEARLNYLQNEIEEKDAQIKTSEVRELELIKEKRNIEDQKRKLQLEVERRIEEEKENIRQEERDRVQKEYELDTLRKDKKIEGLVKEIKKLQYRVNQTNGKVEGTVLEDKLFEDLTHSFPLDNIERVPNGQKGVDIVQIVIDDKGRECGKISWEAKNVKQWKEDWILKIKKDNIRIKADVPIIVTTTLPNGVNSFELRNGVWVVSHTIFLSLAYAIRGNIIELYNAQLSMTCIC